MSHRPESYQSHERPTMRRFLTFVTIVAIAAVAALLGSAPVAAKKKKPAEAPAADPLAEKTAKWDKREGLLDFYVDPETAHVWLEVPATGDDGRVGEYIYVEGLVTGLGSNPVGLDRGQLGPSRVVELRRLGNRLLIVEPNLAFRALSEDETEIRATRESFAPSVLWAGEIDTRAPDGRALVDLTSFLVRDAHGVTAALRQTGQGEYSLDAGRSVVDPDACLAFPDNLEFEALLTYAGDKPGPLVEQTAPNGQAFSLVQHHSLVRLPDDHYAPRRHDPREGSFTVSFQDYAAPLDESIETRWIVRHRLRENPDAEPELVYYVDRGAPEPVRGALVDGASWWAEAFAEAGFPGAFRVELMPEDAHPLDVRYNVIQWVHRSTRGWSYGGGVVDPRTGEMIKGHVSLGSLRVRQDRVIFEGLLGTEKTGSGEADDPVELALARIRQLSAHEVGHTLGLTHNFAASTYAGRASAMDYPAPLIGINEDGSFDVSDAYAVGAGAWDKHAIRYAYSEFVGPDPAAAEEAGLEAIVREGQDNGVLFLADADARPPGAANAVASLWDNGDDPVAQLHHEMKVRRLALDRFGERNVTPGTPQALLEEVLATVYLRHRYQLEATVKMVGGMDYAYTVRGDGRPGPTPVAAERQREALEAVLEILDPAALDLPDTVLAVLSPRPFDYRPNRELFGSRSAPAFDRLGAAATMARQAVGMLLQPERAARLVDFHSRDGSYPGLAEVVERLIAASGTADGDARRAELRFVNHVVLVEELVRLASNGGALPAVRAEAEAALVGLRQRYGGGVVRRDHFLHEKIDRFLNRIAEEEERPSTADDLPPGSPIGGFAGDFELAGCSLGSTPGGWAAEWKGGAR